MLLFSFLLGMALTHGLEVEKCETCVLFNSTCYDTTYLFNLTAPFRNDVVIKKMGILHADNTLFYSFEPRLDDVEYYKVAFDNLDDENKSGVISAGHEWIHNFGTFDIDQDNRLVYLGGRNGIFIDNINEHTIVWKINITEEVTTAIFYKDDVYIVKEGVPGIHFNFTTVTKDNIITILNYTTILKDTTIKNFVIANNDVIVFLSNYGLFVRKDNNTHRISKNAFFRGLAIDQDGNSYAWWIDGLYKVTIRSPLSHSKVEKVVDMPAIGGLVFDKNNSIVFSSANSLYRLIEINKSCVNT